jgi:transcriptional regulator with XRE-family HTH domain
MTGMDTHTIAEGFGARLKDERKRLKLSQEALAEAGGVKRLAQQQYESENSVPNLRYLNAIGIAGVSLPYVLFGIRQSDTPLTHEQIDRIEDRAFRWVEEYAQTRPDGRLGAEARRFSYQMIKAVLIQIESGKLPADFDIDSLKTQHFSAQGNR